MSVRTDSDTCGNGVRRLRTQHPLSVTRSPLTRMATHRAYCLTRGRQQRRLEIYLPTWCPFREFFCRLRRQWKSAHLQHCYQCLCAKTLRSSTSRCPPSVGALLANKNHCQSLDVFLLSCNGILPRLCCRGQPRGCSGGRRIMSMS